MARKNEILYVNFYTDGSAARKIAPAFPTAKPRRKPVAKQKKKMVLRVDPVALCSLAVAVAMLVMIAVGLTSLQNARAEAIAMEEYVQTLTAENERLTDEFYQEVDLEAVEKTALALGMVPSQQVPSIPITSTVAPEEAPAETFWSQLSTFLTNLFA